MKQSLVTVVMFCAVLSLFAGKNPADYPLKVHILQQAWGSHNLRYNEYKATGRGNVWEGDAVHGFDFTYDCSFGIRRTARNEPYLAKWRKPQLRLALLASQIGRNGKYQECELQTTVRDGVYILNNGGITEMSQSDYKTWKTKQDAAKSSNQAGTKDPSAISKLSVASTPDNAEIEIDGEFMGNTPSVLELAPGEHTISVQKPGYKTWEKKMKLAAGAINLKADLEQNEAAR